MPGSQGGDSATQKRQFDKATLRPVTIKQLLDASHPNPDAEVVQIDGSDVSQVTIVGQVRNISAQTTNITYRLDDGTGTIDVKVWVESEAHQNPNEAARPKPVELGYARAWGKLKVLNNKRHLGATVIRPITDYNEISYHLLESTYVHLYHTRGPPETLQKDKEASGGGDNRPAGNVNLSGMSANARAVYMAIRKTPQTNEGLHASDIAQRTGLELNEVLKAGDELQSIGSIYTTVDDTTWALLDIA
jgi:replication factor A2